MSDTGKYLLLTAGLIFLYMKSKAAPSKANTAQFLAFSSASREKLALIDNLFNMAGFSDPGKKFALAQVLHETGEFTSKSKVAALNNNYSGIMWINKPGVQKNAVKGSPYPSKEGKYFYAKFNTPLDWAIDFKRVLMLKNKPLLAANLTDYVTRLHNNKYFTAPVKNYFSGMQKYYNLLTV